MFYGEIENKTNNLKDQMLTLLSCFDVRVVPYTYIWRIQIICNLKLWCSRIKFHISMNQNMVNRVYAITYGKINQICRLSLKERQILNTFYIMNILNPKMTSSAHKFWTNKEVIMKTIYRFKINSAFWLQQ